MKQRVYSHNKVRTSTQDRTLDSMFPVANHSGTLASSSDLAKTDSITAPSNTLSKSREIKESECFLTSVKNLRKKIQKEKHRREFLFFFNSNTRRGHFYQLELTEILEKHIFVGIVDLERCLSLIQYSTKLYLLNHGALA